MPNPVSLMVYVANRRLRGGHALRAASEDSGKSVAGDGNV